MEILIAVEQWRAYLQHAEFVIHTDHCSLSHLEDQRLHTTWQQKVFTKLRGLQFTIKYKKGSTNCAAGALSRRPAPDASLCAISQLQPAWLSDVIASYDSNHQAKELLTRLSLQDATLEHFTLHDGVIRYKNRIWLPTSHPVIVKILDSLHVSPMGGHSGIPITLRRVKGLFYWKNLKASI
jgi:hypothetical protein